MKENEREQANPLPAAGGLPMGKIHFLLMVLVLLFSALLLVCSWRILEGYSALERATEDYIARQQDAADLQAGSDYLTQQARYFAFTGDRRYLDNYFFEAEVTKRRDSALQSLEDSVGQDEKAYLALSAAMERSLLLMQQEYRSMRLMVESRGYPLDAFPQEVRDVALTEEERNMKPERQAEEALGLMFDKEYREAKDYITGSVTACIEQLMDDQNALRLDASHRLLSLLKYQQIYVGLLLASVLTGTVLAFLLIYRPLRRGLACVRSGELFPVEGGAEIRLLASSYNEMFEENRKSRERHNYDATHDILTNLYNRKAYEDILSSLNERTVALLLIDVDRFKGINDTYGHAIGDRILSKVALTLRDNFRADDYVCRVGGDEFAVIMTNMSSDLGEMIRVKVQKANAILQDPDDGLPPVTLSAGAAFGDRVKPSGSIFRDADAALYTVKRNGRNGFLIYE